MPTLVLRNDLGELRRLARWIEDWTAHHMSNEGAFAIQLCLEEVVANIIMHSSTSAERLEIAVELVRVGAAVVARIEDNGREFDPTQVPPPITPTSLAEAKVGNFGVHLVRSFASRIDYKRTRGRNQLTLQLIESEAA
jgi:anti-sigma regulatory factor (Ser/Thr protein kinase)